MDSRLLQQSRCMCCTAIRVYVVLYSLHQSLYCICRVCRTSLSLSQIGRMSLSPQKVLLVPQVSSMFKVMLLLILSLSLSLLSRMKAGDIRPALCQCLRHSNCSIVTLDRLALVHVTVRLASLKTRSDSALIAIVDRISIAICDSCR